jgi:hypothetical protein
VTVGNLVIGTPLLVLMGRQGPAQLSALTLNAYLEIRASAFLQTTAQL